MARFAFLRSRTARSSVRDTSSSSSNTGWKRVEQPLAVLGAEDKVIDGLWVQNASAADLPKFYVTEIKLQ